MTGLHTPPLVQVVHDRPPLLAGLLAHIPADADGLCGLCHGAERVDTGDGVIDCPTCSGQERTA